ncbi:MAG: hypothetical protein R2856_35225 [Caldilineaceae bacterium]
MYPPIPTAPVTPEVVTPQPTVVPDLGSIGDALYPGLGNAGYDVQHYALDLTVDVHSNTITATTMISAVALTALDSFHLDLTGLRVDSVDVAAQPAEFVREDAELIITPAASLAEGDVFTVTVAYGGQPEPRSMPMLGQLGWVQRGDTIVVVSEPFGASTWFPSSDHPQDKATYDIRVTVDEPFVARPTGCWWMSSRRTVSAPTCGTCSIRWPPTWPRSPSTSTSSKKRKDPTGCPSSISSPPAPVMWPWLHWKTPAR